MCVSVFCSLSENAERKLARFSVLSEEIKINRSASCIAAIANLPPQMKEGGLRYEEMHRSGGLLQVVQPRNKEYRCMGA